MFEQSKLWCVLSWWWVEGVGCDSHLSIWRGYYHENCQNK